MLNVTKTLYMPPVDAHVLLLQQDVHGAEGEAPEQNHPARTFPDPAFRRKLLVHVARDRQSHPEGQGRTEGSILRPGKKVLRKRFDKSVH